MSRGSTSASSGRTRLRSRVFLAHAAITAAAGVVLILRPATIPATVGVHVAPDAYLLAYLLGAAELGFAALSWLGARRADPNLQRAVGLACIVLHAGAGLLEATFYLSHPAPILLGNIAARALIVAVFGWLLPRDDEGQSAGQTATQFVRVCAVYFSPGRDTALVAPMFNHAGLFAEQPGAVVAVPAADDAALGQAVRDALERCVFEPEFNYRQAKRSDWPAYQASGCRSIREFEQRFSRFLVQGANASNLVAVIDSPGIGDFDLLLQASVTFHAPVVDLGRCVRYVWTRYEAAAPR